MWNIPVKVTDVVFQGNIWVIENDKTPSEYRATIQIQESKGGFKKNKILPKLKMTVLYESGNLYQRARIEEINMIEPQVTLILLDYGTFQTATPDQLFQMPEDWTTIPFLSKEIILNLPSPITDNEKWKFMRTLLLSSEKVYLHPLRFVNDKILANITLIDNENEINLVSMLTNTFQPTPSKHLMEKSLTSLHSILMEENIPSFSVSNSGFASIAKQMAFRAKKRSTVNNQPRQENASKGIASIQSQPEYKQKSSNRVYVSSHTPLRPISALTLSELSTSIMNAQMIDRMVNEMFISSPTDLQAWLWPAIATGHNSIIAMEPRGRSITLGWLVPVLHFIIEDQMSGEVPDGNAPQVLVLVSCWKEGAYCESLANQLTPHNISKRTLLIHGLGRELECMWALINGVEILIATPPSFLRLCNESKYLTSFSRLICLILQNSDQLLERFPNDIELIIKKSLETAEKRNFPIQFVTTTQTWKEEILKLALKFASRPTVLISSPLEVVAAAGIPLTFHSSRSSIINQLQGRCFVACCNSSEAIHFRNLIKDLLRGELLIAHEGCSQIQLERVQRIWKRSSSSREDSTIVLICTDQVAELMNVRDTQQLFHLTLPEQKECFINRFVSLFKNIDLKEPKHNYLHVHIVLQNRPDWFSRCLDTLKNVSREAAPIVDGELCHSLEAFGQCLDHQMGDCSKRHSFRPEIDLPLTSWPQCGDFVTLQFVSMLDASRFSCRLLTLRNNDGGIRKSFKTDFLRIILSLKNYCDNYSSDFIKINWKLGDFCVVRPGKRARIISLNKDLAKVSFLEETKVETIEINKLLPLPSDRGIQIPLIYQVLLCHLRPRDSETCWSPEVNKYMQQFLTSPNIQISGQIRFVFGQSMWIDNFNIIDTSGSSDLKIDLRKKLIENNYAIVDHQISETLENLLHKNPNIKQDEKKRKIPIKIKTNRVSEINIKKSKEDTSNIIDHIKKSNSLPTNSSIKSDLKIEDPDTQINFSENTTEVNSKTLQIESSDGKIVYDIDIDDLFKFMNTITKGNNNSDINNIPESKITTSEEIFPEVKMTYEEPVQNSSLSKEIAPVEPDDMDYTSKLLKQFEKEENKLLAEIQKPSREYIQSPFAFMKKPSIVWGQDLQFIYLKIYEDNLDRIQFYLRCFAQHVDYVSKEKAIRLELFGPIFHVDHKKTGRYLQVKLLKMVPGLMWPSLLYDKNSEIRGLIHIDHELLNSQMKEYEHKTLSIQNELLLTTSLALNTRAVPALQSVGIEQITVESGASSDSEEEDIPTRPRNF